MKKLLLLLLLIPSLSLANGVGVIRYSENCETLIQRGIICQSTIDGKIYKGTGIGIEELTGGTGTIGPPGPQGIQGEPGIQGIQGLKGNDGLPGSSGAKGDKGDIGLQGLSGTDGQQGIQGIPGIKGDKGDTGLQGIQGIQGVQGNPGINGVSNYTLSIQALTSSPTDAQTVYFGNLPKAPITTANISKVYIRKAGTIKIAEIYCYSGTAGTAEAWSLYIRKNNTTDYLIKTLSVATNERIFTNEALNIAVVVGDYIEIKGIQPTWATNPATSIYSGYLYIE